MLLVDVHAHLDHAAFKDDLDAVIDRARKAGVKAIITQGVNHTSNLQCLELAKKYDIVHAALGLYPLDAVNVKVESMPPEDADLQKSDMDVDSTLKFIEENKDNIAAIGEVGMDFAFSSDVKNQEENFLKIIKLSERIDKPLIIHSRKAESQVLDLLESSNARRVDMHCFSGKLKLAKRIADNGWFMSVPVSIFRAKHFQELVLRTDLNYILTETDAPYLGGVPGERNEPANTIKTINKIAELKNMTPEDTSNVIFANYQRLFL